MEIQWAGQRCAARILDQGQTGLEHIFGLDSLRDGKTCVAFGSFDGLHIGHRAVVHRMAAYTGLQKILLSIEPEDRPVLVTESEKAFLLRNSPIDCLISVPEKQITEFSGREFVRKVLIGKLRACVVAAGTHSGLYDELLAFSRDGAFQLAPVSPVCSNESPVSSELVKQCIESGSFRSLLDLLGHPYPVQGIVVHGKGKGRTQGMPTANLRVPENKILPPYGVYGSIVHIKDGIRTGLTNIGLRPSVDNIPVPTVETHILDFDGDLYGQELTVEIREWIRETRKFDGGLKEVTEQVGRDIEYVRNIMTV